MARDLDLLNNIRIAAPCPASWSEMSGTDRVRFCNQCRKNVFNISEMPAAEAAALIREKQGNLCIRLYRRQDGTVITNNCPVGLRTLRKGLAKILGATAAVFSLLAGVTILLPNRWPLAHTIRATRFQPAKRVAALARAARHKIAPQDQLSDFAVAGSMSLPMLATNPAQLVQVQAAMNQLDQQQDFNKYRIAAQTVQK